MIKINFNEDQRQVVSLWLAWSGWSATAVLVLLRSFEAIPIQFATITLLTIGVGIAASLSRGRMRLTEALAQTFETGIKVATVLQTNMTTSACIVEVDIEGTITSVEHVEVIGWRRDSLVGKPLDTLVPDRFLRQHQDDFRRFRDSGESQMAGATISVPITTETGGEVAMRLSIARLGDAFLGTLVPNGPINEAEEW